MAKRPVFTVFQKAPRYLQVDVEFHYNSGFSAAQKQRNIQAIHKAYLTRVPNDRILEISSKSETPLGVSLSAFNLMKYVPALGRSIPVENVFQGGKVFDRGGPYMDLYGRAPREAKKDERLKNSGELVSFVFDGQQFPLVPRTAFYDWIYISALRENPILAEELLEYDAFTDVEFNPGRSLNCQARAAAVFVSLSRSGLLQQVTDFASFLDVLGSREQGKSVERRHGQQPAQSEADAPEQKQVKPTFSVGDRVIHPSYGEGEVVQVLPQLVKLCFGETSRVLGAAWVEANCKKVE